MLGDDFLPVHDVSDSVATVGEADVIVAYGFVAGGLSC